MRNLFLTALTIFFSIGCSSAHKDSNSDHYKDGAFFNPNSTKHLSFFSVFSHIAFGRNGKWTDYIPRTVDFNRNERINIDEIKFTMVGHSTVLIQFHHLNILTDPVWSEKVGPFSWAGPQRAQAPGVSFEQLPKINVILVSHNHFDHMDLPTLKMISHRDEPTVIVPLGNQKFLTDQGIKNVIELDWWQKTEISSALFYLTPSQHNSGRGLFDRDQTLWGSFLIEYNKIKVYFAGDTAYENHFSKTQGILGSPDIALIPIGAYLPKEKMDAFHLNPHQAVDAFIDLKAQFMIPIHYDNFQLSNEDFGQPVKDLTAALEMKRIDSNFIKILKPAQAWIFRNKKGMLNAK